MVGETAPNSEGSEQENGETISMPQTEEILGRLIAAEDHPFFRDQIFPQVANSLAERDVTVEELVETFYQTINRLDEPGKDWLYAHITRLADAIIGYDDFSLIKAIHLECFRRSKENTK
jgi:hypothetical protein